MAKEKVQQIEIKDNERLFHYEIIGIIILILSVFAITKMGIIGLYLMLIIKVLFGDWYFLILGLLIAYGVRCIVFHNKLSIGNIRYIGIFLIILSLILLSHFSMHKYVKNYEENNLKLTLKLYLNFFKTQSIDSIVGGGVIGSLFFYLGYYLLSEFGVIIISIFLLFIGIVFLSKKTIKDFIMNIFYFIKKICLMLSKTRFRLKSSIDSFDDSYKKNKIKFKISKIDNNKYYYNELEISKRNAEIIKKSTFFTKFNAKILFSLVIKHLIASSNETPRCDFRKSFVFVLGKVVLNSCLPLGYLIFISVTYFLNNILT